MQSATTSRMVAYWVIDAELLALPVVLGVALPLEPSEPVGELAPLFFSCVLLTVGAGVVGFLSGEL